jgi:hypothetical protein
MTITSVLIFAWTARKSLWKNAYLHTIADMLLGSYPDYRRTISTDNNRTTTQDIGATVDKMKQICDFDVGAELYSWESLIME